MIVLSARIMKILIVHFSYQSTVERVAESIAARLIDSGHRAEIKKIEPVKQLRYWQWLALSFLPGTRVKIRPTGTSVGSFDRLCLGFPKWTFSCPPVNEFLAVTAIPETVPLGLFMVYGGWDEERYLRAMIRRLSPEHPILASMALKRRRVLQGQYQEDVSEFCSQVTSTGSEP